MRTTLSIFVTASLAASTSPAVADDQPEPEVAMAGEEQEAPTEPADDAELTGYDEGFFIRSPDGKYTMQIHGTLVSRYSTTTEVADGARTATTDFEVPAAPIVVAGQLGSPRVGYEAGIELAEGTAELDHYFADFGVGGDVKLRVGQFMRPFSRQQINAGENLELGDLAITEAFGGGNDLGVELHDGLEDSPTFEWAVGVFNGTGEDDMPVPVKPVLVGRFGANTEGLDGYSEGDLDGGPVRAGVASSVLIEGGADDDGESITRVAVDGVVKAYGFSASAAIFEQTQQDVEWAHRDHDAWGFHVQTGYVFAGRHEIVARVAVVDPDHADDATTETAVGYTLYLRGHEVKWQTDLGVVHETGHRYDDGVRARTQLQLGF